MQVQINFNYSLSIYIESVIGMAQFVLWKSHQRLISWQYLRKIKWLVSLAAKVVKIEIALVQIHRYKTKDWEIQCQIDDDDAIYIFALYFFLL
jgi:hypothetical protein